VSPDRPNRELPAVTSASSGDDLPARVPRRVVGARSGSPPAEPAATPASPRGRGPWFALLGVLAAAAGLLVVPGLLRGDEGSSALNPIAQAAEKTVAWPGARMSLEGAMAGLPGGASVSMSGRGVFNGQTERSEMTMSASASGVPGIEAFEITAVGDGFDVYLRSPLLTAGLPGGKSWMLIRNRVGSEAADQAGVTGGDPREQLRYLRSVSDAVTLVGRASIRGVPTRHYAATIDLEGEVERLRDEDADEVADALEKSLDALGSSEQDIEVWIDRKGLVRRMGTSIPFELFTEGARMSMTMDFFDFGIRPRIDLPPGDQVFDATELAEEALKSL
jgi:hypothetical protein